MVMTREAILDERLQGANVKSSKWVNYDQLQSMVTSGQVNITSTPVTNALKLYNKGVDLRLINVSMWGMLYVISQDENLDSINDLVGKEIGIFGKGGIHDLVFRHIMIKNGFNPDNDVNITYLELPELSSRLAMGTLDYAVLNEPASSIALLNAKKQEVNLYRSIDLQEEWAKTTGSREAKIPMAGFIIVGDNIGNETLVKEFLDTYNQSIKWINENSDKSGLLVEKYFEQMKAPAVTSSLEFAQLESINANESRKYIEDFFTKLLETAPAETIGGNLPGDQFYYNVD